MDASGGQRRAMPHSPRRWRERWRIAVWPTIPSSPCSIAGSVARRRRTRIAKHAALATTRFQQLSAPLAAKAVEDTAFYRHGVLLSRNEVGADISRLWITAEEFHARCLARRESFPDAMLATATHDHKRGEDVRARLAVLSEMPAQWAASVRDG